MRFIKPLSLAIGSVLLAACATTSNTTPVAPIAQGDAKDNLQKAMQSQLRSSFSYQTNIYVSNKLRQEALKDTALQQKDGDCQTVHDDAYVALAKLAKQNKQDIDDDTYKDQRQKIRDDYLACEDKKEPVYAYESFDLDNFYQTHKNLDTQQQAKKFVEQIQTHIIEQSEAPFQESEESEDTSITELDIKKAKLLHEYLLKPTQVSVVGSYEPLKGKISALPTINYQAKNLNVALNQPIYIDIKNQGIYLWADNFALANSQFLDKTLGDKWYNKWLFIPINDGSLPPTFAKDLVKAYLDAKKESFNSLKATDFQVIDSAQFDAPFINDTLPADAIAHIKQTPYIIKQQTNPKEKAYSDYIFADTLYNTITEKYPSLAIQKPMFRERVISEGQSVIKVANISDDNKDNKDKKLNINSEFLMRALFASLKERIDDYTADTNQSHRQPSPYAPITHYGMTNGKLSWLHHRHYLTNFGLPNKEFSKTFSNDEPIFIDSFTLIHQRQKDMGEFSRLPTAVQTPNGQNSVNVFDYKNELIERLKHSNDKYLHMMMALLLGEDATTQEALPEESPAND